MVRVYIALGSNLNNPLNQLEQAVKFTVLNRMGHKINLIMSMQWRRSQQNSPQRLY